jgi:hypothetical protein
MGAGAHDRSMMSQLIERHRATVERRRRLFAEAERHQAVLSSTARDAQFRSWKSFYESDTRRRGDDVVIKDLFDREIRWSVCWLPRTHEVVAFAVGWADERWHPALFRSGGSIYFPAGCAGLGVAVVPELVNMLGHAESAAAATAQLAAVSTVAEARSALEPRTPDAQPSRRRAATPLHS